MTKALDIHHNVIRKVIERYSAYEVKTIGDSFMVALSSADTAVLLANDIQKDLLDADWPQELANMPSGCSEFVHIRGQKEDKLVNRGLRVRIGIHVGKHSDLDEEGGGQVQTKYDCVAKGYDYYGPAVNAAARIEALAFGGQTLISSEVYFQLSQAVKAASLLHVVGGLQLKGIEDEMFIYQCLPIELKGRAFKGVLRRRDSAGGSIAGNTDSVAMVIEIGGSILESEDMTSDVMTLTPIQLQGLASRLRSQLIGLENKVSMNGERDDLSACSALSLAMSIGDADGEAEEAAPVNDGENGAYPQAKDREIS